MQTKIANKNLKTSTISTWSILRTIYTEYITKIPLLRYSIGPILITMVIARLMEIKVTEIVQRASKYLNIYRNSNIYLEYLFVSILSSFLVEIQGFIFTSSIQRAFRISIRNSIVEYLKLEYFKFKTLGIGEITSNIERQSNSISEILDVFVLSVLPVLFVLVISVIKIYFTLGLLSSVIVSISLFLYVFITVKIAVWRNSIRKRLNLSINDSKDKLYDILNNYDSIISYNNQNYEIEDYNEKLIENEKHYVRLWQTFYLLNFLQKFVFCLKIGLIIFIGMKNQIQPDEFVLFLSISRVLGVNLDKFGYMYSRFTTAILNGQMGYLKVQQNKQLFPIRYFEKNIRFQNVGLCLNEQDEVPNDQEDDLDLFGYEKSESNNRSFVGDPENSLFAKDSGYIFRNLNFEIQKGEKIALIGANGTGKSNLLKVLLKFNKYTGSILIDNDELSTIKNDTIRDLISYIPQDSYLLSGSIKENLKYGNKFVSDREMVELCKYLNYHESFMNLSAGYETFIGKNNSILSGGEKQKIAIIRSLLKPAEIYLFDEPTANLDRKSEQRFFEYLQNHEKSKTVIVIVHNLEMIKHFDRILYLKKDGVEEISEDQAYSYISKR